MANWFQMLLILVALIAGALYALPSNTPEASSPATIKVGVLPDQNQEILRDRYLPLLNYLSEFIKVPTQLIIPEDYEDLLTQFQKGKLDLAYFGSATFVNAMNAYEAKPLVMRDIDVHFTSSFIVHADSAYESIEDLQGARCAFGSALSTSGHVMPRQFLLSEFRIRPEHFFSEVTFSGTHDQTAYMVRDGIADVGAINARLLQNMLTDGRLRANDIRIIWQTPPYANYVWATQKDAPEKLRTNLRNAFLSLNREHDQGRHILKKLSAKYFVPAKRSDFNILSRNTLSNNTLSDSKFIAGYSFSNVR